MAFCMFPLHCLHLRTKEYLPTSLEYFFDALQTKDYESMRNIIRKKTTQIAQSRQQGDTITEEFYVQQALLIVLSKPNRDNMNRKLLQKIKQDGQLYGDKWFDYLMNVTQKACLAIQNKERSSIERATYLYIIENIIEEVSLHLQKVPKAQTIFVYIKDAKIKIPEEVHEVRYIRSLKPQVKSPSAIAKQWLQIQGLL